MQRKSGLWLSSAALFLFMSMAACDKVNLTEVAKVGNQLAGSQTAEGGTSGGGMAGSPVGQLISNVPISVPPSTVAKLGNVIYDWEVGRRTKETDTKLTNPVDKIFEQLKAAALTDQTYGNVAKDMDWRLNTLREKSMAQAKAFPGGGIAVYEGVFPIAENEGALAGILGHEIAHVLARHELKRLTGDVAVAASNVGSAIALGTSPDKIDRQAIAAVTGALGIGYVVGGRQHWERSQESEADCLGLQLAAKAGYDPRKIKGFWRTMAETEKPNGGYQFLNDHPINEDRLAHIENTCLPPAEKVYDQVPGEKRQDASATLPELPPDITG